MIWAEAGNQTQSAPVDNRSATGCTFGGQFRMHRRAFGQSGGSSPRQFNLILMKIDKG